VPSYQSYLKEIRGTVSETDIFAVKHVVDAKNGAGSPALIDVREQNEWVQGYIPGAQWISRGNLESKIEDAVPDRSREVILYCASGNRSVLAARSLRELGYTDVKSLAGGFTAWKRAGYTFDLPMVMTQEQNIRYSRHTMLPEVGEAGQIKLLKSRVLLLGAGGLGAPSSVYLAAAGVGTLGLVDDDVVDLSNLQRQIIHAQDRIGMPKVDSAKIMLNGLNPDVKIVPHKMRLTSDNIMSILGDYDLVVDGADNFPTRYLLNDAALKLGKPVIHASIFRFEGQLTAFIPNEGPCYRCLYPQPPPPDMAPSCQEAGVLGVLPGIIGSLQANEAIKVLLGMGTSLAGRLLIFDALKTKFRELKLRRDPQCPTCGEGTSPERIELIDYEQFCAIS
jgi:molybdopterin/thiamine biosynthesis adenylyltransferase/rhodanese-related sulfurtransferase